MTTIPKTELLDFLRRSEATPVAKAFLERTFQEFVLEYGWWYEPTEFPLRIAAGTPQECHKNAAGLALAGLNVGELEEVATRPLGVRLREAVYAGGA
jgi:hypothetical protein